MMSTTLANDTFMLADKVRLTITFWMVVMTLKIVQTLDHITSFTSFLLGCVLLSIIYALSITLQKNSAIHSIKAFILWNEFSITFVDQTLTKLHLLFWLKALISYWQWWSTTPLVETWWSVVHYEFKWPKTMWKLCIGLENQQGRKHSPLPVANGWAGAENRNVMWPMDRLTNQPTDQPTDMASFRVVCPRLKRWFLLNCQARRISKC